MEWIEIVPVIAIVLGAVLVIAKAITKLTPNTKDDEVVDKIAGIVEPVIDSLDGKDEPES